MYSSFWFVSTVITLGKKKHGTEYLIDHLLYLELCCHPALRLINNGNLNYRSILKSSFRIKASGDEKEGRDQSLQ